MGLFGKRSVDAKTSGQGAEGAGGTGGTAPPIDALKQSGDAEGLRQLLVSAAEEKRRVAATWALVDLRDVQAVEILIDIVGRQSEPSNLRFQAIGALGKLHDARAVPALSAILNSKEQPAPAQAGAAVSLGWIGDPACADALAQAWLGADDERVQEAAGKAFLELRVTRSEYLLHCLEDPVRCERAAALMGRFADTKALEPLEALRARAEAAKAKGAVHACREAMSAIRERAGV
jgi:HEAT repeat protein